MRATQFTPQDPAYQARVQAGFAKQGLMTLLGASLGRVVPGAVDIVLRGGPSISQQHGFVHAGAVAAIADTAAGYAALTLMPPGRDVLTVEFKINLLSPAQGFVTASAAVVRAGRTLTVVQAEVMAERDDERKRIALLTATLISVADDGARL